MKQKFINDENRSLRDGGYRFFYTGRFERFLHL